MGQPTLPGIITACASVITALALLMTAFSVLLPILRKQVIAERKLDSIHVLVNSTLTAAKDAQRAGAERELVLLTEMADLHREAGRGETAAETAALQAAKERVVGLRAELEERARQTDRADWSDAERPAR